MNVVPSSLPDVLIIEPKVFGDARGFFYESYNAREFADKTGIEKTNVINVSIFDAPIRCSAPFSG